MKFRPCIDIHNGKVKQIVGGSLTDVQDQASENFVSEQDASFYAELYKKAGIKGGHVILLNGHDSPYYESTNKISLPVHHLYASRHDNVTSSIQDTVCLELEKCNKTASSYKDSIHQNLFLTLRSAAQKDIPIISFRILRDHFLHML